MTKINYEMITARRNLVEKMNRENRTDEEKYQACMNLKYEEYITEIHNAEEAIEEFKKNIFELSEEVERAKKCKLCISSKDLPLWEIKEK